MQDGTTADMIFGIPELIEFISAAITLEPGDVIATGTPSGVGVFREPPVFLEPGDRVRCEIEGIGSGREPGRRLDATPPDRRPDRGDRCSPWSRPRPDRALGSRRPGAGDRHQRRPDPRPQDRASAAPTCTSSRGIRGRRRRSTPPLVVGHEFVGEIVEVGSNVADFHPGDLV